MSSQRKLVIGLAVLGLLSGCGKSTEAPSSQASAGASLATPIASTAITVTETRTLRPTFELPAITEALQTAEIRPEVQAILREMHFAVGDLVEKDDLLVVLDPSKYQAQLAAAEANLQAAHANLEQAENNWDRAKKLGPQGYISALDRDRAKSGVGTARASVAQAKAGVAEAQLRLSRTTIKAPFSGKISRPYHAVGDLVGPLAIEPLFQLVQLDPIYARANIELSMYNDFVALRSKLTEDGIEIPDLEVFIELAGGQDYPYPGEFKGWSQSARGSQGTISGRVLYPNPKGLLLPGQNITIRGQAANKVERLVVPQRAVQQDQQGHFLKIIDQDNVVQRRNIQVGVREGTDWSIVPGSSELAEGDRVIAEGGSAYREGTTVEIVTQP